MCGIAGMVYRDRAHPPEAARLQAMTDLLAHRGPDDAGVLLAPGIALGMRRLSIIDVAGGHQPVFSEDGQVGVVFNGEIYNYQALRAELAGRGHTFRTRTDTEVIVHGYEAYGAAIVPRLHGMFALALWDGATRTLLLARDRLGKKPLHYAVLPDRLLLGSEIKALLLDPALPRDLDLAALDDVLAYGHTLGERTIFQAVRKLPPAHYLLWQDGAVRLERYWDVALTGADGRGEAELVEELRWRLAEAVRERLLSEVPLGAFLSGGLDSSTVVAYMAAQLPQPVKTFAIGFAEADFNELAYARTVARHFGTDHHEFIVRPAILDDLPRLVWAWDEPFADESAIPTYYVSRLARDHVTVVLSGDGGDESFGGYLRYARLAGGDPLLKYVPRAVWRALPVARLMPVGVRGQHRLRLAQLGGAERYADGMMIFPDPLRQRLYTGAVADRLRGRDTVGEYTRYFQRAGAWGEGEGADALVRGAQTADLHRYLPDDILVKVDRMSMLASVETRCPLLDHRLVEFMAGLPVHWKVRGGETKYLLKRAMAGIVPEAVLTRPKMGFGVPLGGWFRGELKGLVHEVLDSSRVRQRGLFDAGVVGELVRQHERGRADHQRRLWTLVCIELWARLYLDGSAWQRRPSLSTLPVSAPAR